MAEIRRQTAYKLNINQILSSKYTQMQGWEPNYLQFDKIKVSRVNIIAIVISKENNLLTIEDGTGKIQVRAFQETKTINELQPGDIVLIIARPREYNSEKYLALEIIRKLDTNKWLEFRKKELESQILKPIIKEESIQEQPSSSTNNLSLIIEKIRELDKGDGVDIENLISQLNIQDPNKHITTLLNEGEIFEIRPGKLKVLD
ncbi:MAG: OB-fold nucleic acid binding domain-containing protein [Candidatus Woesearchaeota archaeon]